MRHEKGNALFIILIAIGLLGAATAMFTRSSSTTDDTGDYEQTQITANRIMNDLNTVALGVQNLIMRGCSENSLSFWYDSNRDGNEDGDDLYYNADAPSDHSCHVFHPSGAGVTPTKPPAPYAKDDPLYYKGKYFFFAQTEWKDNGDNCGEDRCVDLIGGLRDLSQSLCQQINTMLGIEGIPSNTTWGGAQFDGTYESLYTLANEPSSAAAAGKPAACFYGIDQDSYTFQIILHAR